MGYTIAVAGKGGTGKTTLSALIIDYLLKTNQGPILAVDADPNSNLNEDLGVKVDRTVISAVDEIMERKEALPAGITKERYLEYHLQDALVEAKGFDLLVMGRTEGPGCYCHANNLLRDFIDRLSKNYRYVIMDNEAGMEHLSRRTTRDIDALLIVANPTPVALRTSLRIYETVKSLKLKIKESYLVINEVMQNRQLEETKGVELPLLGRIPYDEEVEERTIKADSLLNLPGQSIAQQSVNEMMNKLRL